MARFRRVKEAFSSPRGLLKAIEMKEVDGENKADYNEDLLPTELGKCLLLNLQTFY